MKSLKHFEDGIQDIVFKNNEVYLVKKNILSIAEIEKQIADLQYNKEYGTGRSGFDNGHQMIIFRTPRALGYGINHLLRQESFEFQVSVSG